MWQAMAAGAVYIARGMGKTQIEMKTTVLVLVINIIASYTLIHIVSYRGVVFGTAGAMIISPIYCYYLLCKEFKSSFFNFLFESFAIPVICCGSSITVIFLIRKVVPFSTGKWIDMCVATVSFFILGHVLYYFSNYKPYIELMHIIEVIPNKGREIVNSFFSRKKNS
jgi:peptidoglycan biosynthesis protein MviN/MurJ (putative lipid II flippase)